MEKNKTKMLTRRIWPYFLLLVAALAIYLFSRSPDNAGLWKLEQTRTPFAEIVDDHVSIHNIRDFRYDEGGTQVLAEHYFDRTYALDDLQRIWFGLSHFGPYGLAHSFLSFEFGSGEYLVLSVEARLRPEQSYNPLLGLLRSYTKIYILSTEQDVIGVRSAQRGERVLMYPVLKDEKTSSKDFLLALLDDMNALHEKPAFYNTLFDNCLTNLLKHSAQVENISLTDSRVLLPGRTDRLTYALGTTPDDIPFDSARSRATINPQITGLDEENFSDLIRCGWHGYGNIVVPECPKHGI
jgi:hypothetical protein